MMIGTAAGRRHTTGRTVGRLIAVLLAGGLVVSLRPVAAWGDPTGGPASGAPGSAGSGVTWPAIPPGRYSTEAPPLTGAELAAADAKSATAMRFFLAAQRAWAAQAGTGATQVASESAATVSTAKWLLIPLQFQQTGWWCGPATMAMIVKYLGHGFAGSVYQQQQAAANMLGTTQRYGTDYGAMRPALNTRIASSFYINQPLPSAPSSAQITAFEADLVSDIYSNYPIAANEYAIPAYWLVNQYQAGGGIIAHWLAVNGYAYSGTTTRYQDPGWGDQNVGFYHEPSPFFVTALGGRGYVW